MNPKKLRQSYLDQTAEMVKAMSDPNLINNHLLIEILYWLMVVVEKLDSIESELMFKDND